VRGSRLVQSFNPLFIRLKDGYVQQHDAGWIVASTYLKENRKSSKASIVKGRYEEISTDLRTVSVVNEYQSAT